MQKIKNNINILTAFTSNDWDTTAKHFLRHTFLQSWAWGEFENSLGNVPIRLVVTYKNNPIALMQLIIKHDYLTQKVLKLRTVYAYIPYGPLFPQHIVEEPNTVAVIMKQLHNYIRKKIQAYNVDFILLESPYPLYPEESISRLIDNSLLQMGYKYHFKSIQARHKWLLSLSHPLEEIFKNMRKVSRYNIRQAERLGVRITRSTSVADLRVAYKILKETSQTKKFVIHSFDYYYNQLKFLGKKNQAHLYLAVLNKNVLSFALILRFGNHYAYAWGGTNTKIRKRIPAAYPLLWQAIKDAKAEGGQLFDFWGIAPPKDKTQPTATLPAWHRWYGLSFFKTSFGGYYEELPLPYVYVINKRKYYLAKMIHRARSTLVSLRQALRTTH